MAEALFVSRRAVLLTGLVSGVAGALPAFAQQDNIWSAAEAYAALTSDRARLVDVRSRAEWAQTGIAERAWPISLHEPRFAKRLLIAQSLAGGRPVAVICAVGGRSNAVLSSMLAAGYNGIVDVSEGMMGSARGPGWIAGGFPIVSMEEALRDIPVELA